METNNIYNACTNRSNNARSGGQPCVQRSYIDAQDEQRLKKSGGTMSGNINMANNKISNIADPVQSGDLVHKHYVDSITNWKINRTGDTMTGDLMMDGNLVKGLPITYPPINIADYKNGVPFICIRENTFVLDENETNVDTFDPSRNYSARYEYVVNIAGLYLVTATVKILYQKNNSIDLIINKITHQLL